MLIEFAVSDKREKLVHKVFKAQLDFLEAEVQKETLDLEEVRIKSFEY